MPPPLILYSTNASLAYKIGQRYYGETHFVWCAPYPAENPRDRYAGDNPPSSAPLTIYRQLASAVSRNDRHDAKIRAIRAGLTYGAELRRQQGIIGDEERTEVVSIVENAELGEFAPLLYLIPYAQVGDMAETVPVSDRANPLAEELRIQRLPRSHFDILSWS